MSMEKDKKNIIIFLSVVSIILFLMGMWAVKHNLAWHSFWIGGTFGMFTIGLIDSIKEYRKNKVKELK